MGEEGFDAGSSAGPEISQGESQIGGEQPTGNEGGNPAWNEILGALPDSLHPTVRPALEKWDTNYRNGIQKVHSQYEPYKPLIDAGYDPQTLQYALAVLDKLENDPRAIYDALAEHNGWAAGEQGQPESESGDEDYDGYENPLDPRIERAEQLSTAVAEYIMQQHQQQQEAEEDAALDAEISELKQKHGIAEDDAVAEKFVMGLMLAGASAEQAFAEYMNVQTAAATRPRANSSAPAILGGGGGVPSSQVPVSQLRNGSARKQIVAQMLAQQE